MVELKKCPFCGGKAHLEDMGYPHHVYCTRCGAKVTGIGYSEDGENDAIEKWNTRIIDSVEEKEDTLIAIASTILYSQYAILEYIKSHSDGMDDEYKERLEKYMTRIAADLMLRL